MVVNNAGITRDSTVVNMTEADFDAVIDVHLKGTFAMCHWAGNYWREQSKSGKDVVDELSTLRQARVFLAMPAKPTTRAPRWESLR